MRMIFSENRFPLFGIMRVGVAGRSELIMRWRRGRGQPCHSGEKPTLRRPYSLRGAGYACIPGCIRRASETTEGARNAGSATDPQTSTPRGTEALPKSGLEPPGRRFAGVRRQVYAVCASLTAMRGVWRFAPRRPRWTSRFRRPALRKATYPPLSGPNGAQHIWPCRLPPSVRPSDVRKRHAGTVRLGPPVPLASHLQRPAPATAPPPRVCRRWSNAPR